MKKLTLLISILAITLSTFAQQPPLNQREIDRAESSQSIEKASKRLDELNNLKPKNNQNKPTTPKIPATLKEQLKVSDQEKKEIEASLTTKEINLFKIWNNVCGNKIYDLSNENCLQKADYFAGSGYSLYLKEHRFYYSHLQLINSEIYAASQDGLIQLLAKIGDIPLQQITNDLPEVNNLRNFSQKEKDVQKTIKKINAGFKLNNLPISSKSQIDKNQTYLLRSVFMDTRYYPSFKIDKIYAIRFINESDDIVTIAWKEIK